MGRDANALNVWHIPAPGEVKSYWLVYDIPSNVTRLPRNAMGIGVVGLTRQGPNRLRPHVLQGAGAQDV